jgi:hypothetical protein
MQGHPPENSSVCCCVGAKAGLQRANLPLTRLAVLHAVPLLALVCPVLLKFPAVPAAAAAAALPTCYAADQAAH